MILYDIENVYIINCIMYAYATVKSMCNNVNCMLYLVLNAEI